MWEIIPNPGKMRMMHNGNRNMTGSMVDAKTKEDAIQPIVYFTSTQQKLVGRFLDQHLALAEVMAVNSVPFSSAGSPGGWAMRALWVCFPEKGFLSFVSLARGCVMWGGECGPLS